jgi:hypothetical protein
MDLWIPGMGNTNSRAYLVDRAINAYDERLMFARNEDTNDWCVFVRMPRPQKPWPLIGFGDSIPDASVVLEKVKNSHLVHNKERIWKEIVDSQKAYRKNLEYKGDQASEESAEVVEHLMRKHGKSPLVKIFPKGVSADDVG